MSETEPQQPKTIEQLAELETKELIETFTKLRSKYNLTNPDLLPLENDDVADAMEDRDEWELRVGQGAKSKGTEEAEQERVFLISSFFVHAGFTDPDYLVEVHDWISQDEERAIASGFVALAARIRVTIDAIEAQLHS